MKSLKLLLTIALPLSTLLSSLPAAAAPQLVAKSDRSRTCYWRVTNGWLKSENRGTPINVRDGASTKANARHIGYAGDGVIVVDRTMGKDGYCWYKIKFESKAVGWVRGDFVMPNLDH